MELLLTVVTQFIRIYSLLIIVRILMSWFQTAEWAYSIISFLSPVTDPYLNIFRSFIPPLGGLDLSPILAILLLNLLSNVLGNLTYSYSMGF
ncbi:MAG: YggT family protein [Microcystaceae cyanobacterium]